MHCRVLSSNPGLHPPDAKSDPESSCDNKVFTDVADYPPQGQNSPH